MSKRSSWESELDGLMIRTDETLTSYTDVVIQALNTFNEKVEEEELKFIYRRNFRTLVRSGCCCYRIMVVRLRGACESRLKSSRKAADGPALNVWR